MTKTAPSAIAVGVAATAIGTLVYGEAIASPIWKNGEWLRLAITGIALLISAYIIWKNRVETALQDSVSALKTAVEAHKSEAEALIIRIKRVEEERHKLEAECAALKVKTDVGEVLKMLTVLTSTTNKRLEGMEVVLREIQQKIHGWKLDRRDALRHDEHEDDGAGRRSSEEDDHRGGDGSESLNRGRRSGRDPENRR